MSLMLFHRGFYTNLGGPFSQAGSDSGRIASHPVFAQSSAVFALRKSRPRGARRCCFQLLLGFCIVLFSDHAVAIRLTETALTYSSITPSVDSLPPHTHAFGPPGLGRIWARRSSGNVLPMIQDPARLNALLDRGVCVASTQYATTNLGRAHPPKQP